MKNLVSLILPMLMPDSLKEAPARVTRKLARKFTVGFFLFLAGACFALAALVWISARYGYDIGFLALGGLCLFIALMAYVIMSDDEPRPRQAITAQPVSDPSAKTGKSASMAASSDPLAKLMPESLTAQESVNELVAQVDERPLLSIAAAFAIGLALTSR